MSKTIRKKAEEAAKQFFPKSTFASVILVGFVVLVFVNLHPFNESLAQEIATALITVDGLILGFTIVGVTVVTERGFSIPRMTTIFEKYLKEFIEEQKVATAFTWSSLRPAVSRAVPTIHATFSSHQIDGVAPPSEASLHLPCKTAVFNYEGPFITTV